jgi:hypothetical protein
MKALSRPQKILAVMLDLCKGSPQSLLYEDIVVASFRMYPEDFQLRGYPEFPDSSDIHKPLYEMKRAGLVRAANKKFQLTPQGLDVARELLHSDSSDRNRLTKAEESEIKRIVNSAAFGLFQEGRSDSILDTDFYEYLGVTARTGKGDFWGRVRNVEHAIKAHSDKRRGDLSKALEQMHNFLFTRFKDELDSRD